jgi:hypothetical protein
MKKPSPLSSLLTLAAGAAALPVTADASIIYIDYTASPKIVGFGGGGQLTTFTLDLPGTADLKFATGTGIVPSSHRIVANQANTLGYVRIGRQLDNRSVTSAGSNGTNVAFRTDAGAHNWNAADRSGAETFGNVVRSASGALTTGPGPFSNKYLLFTFKNSLAGDQLRYGWVCMSDATVANMSVTLTGWAYDDTGDKINAGAIPEPGTASLAMGGALMLGAAGLRQWRKRNAATAKNVGDLIAS